jgi:hypothetical protein
MSAPVSIMNSASLHGAGERAHRLRLQLAALTAVLSVITLAVYGWNYYLLDATERPFSPKHELLKPSGSIAIKLGIAGVLLFMMIFLYPLRKRIKWLGRIGSAKHWLDFHVIAGLTAPVLIAFHASFKFRGIAGIAFWIMLSVAISGVIGRYIYAQIPRSLSSAELSLKELAEIEEELSKDLSVQSPLSAQNFTPLLQVPTPAQVREMSVCGAILLMIVLDLCRPFHVARLRIRVLGWSRVLPYCGGFIRTSHEDLERTIRIARTKAALSKRIAFLSRSQQVFHLWHVIHRPFSYSFAVLALIHIVVVIALGFV